MDYGKAIENLKGNRQTFTNAFISSSTLNMIALTKSILLFKIYIDILTNEERFADINKSVFDAIDTDNSGTLEKEEVEVFVRG